MFSLGCDTAARVMAPRVAIGVLLALVLLAGAARLILDTPALLLAAALLPALLLAFVVVRLDAQRHAQRRLWIGAFLWGAAVAPALATLVNGALRAWLASWSDGAVATTWTGRLGAPLVEETAKAAALVGLALVWRDDVRDGLDGLLFGALIGLGFTVAENCYYFALAALGGGADALAESVYLRAALGGPLHAIFTATAGAGIGAARARQGAARWWPALLGFALAVAQHAAWNALGAGWLDGAPCAPGAAACEWAGRVRFWIVIAPLIVVGFAAPGLLGLAWMRRRTLAARAAAARRAAPAEVGPA
jgi:RsiW-degrading membrane proteinase PrsW (M82 family)